MSFFHPQDAAEPRQPAPPPALPNAPGRAELVLVPFPAPGARRPRRSPRADERRGEILLFLGVRYERLAS